MDNQKYNLEILSIVQNMVQRNRAVSVLEIVNKIHDQLQITISNKTALSIRRDIGIGSFDHIFDNNKRMTLENWKRYKRQNS
jgi:hypothetical protein